MKTGQRFQNTVNMDFYILAETDYMHPFKIMHLINLRTGRSHRPPRCVKSFDVSVEEWADIAGPVGLFVLVHGDGT